MMMNHDGGVVGFNMAFDHFHLSKIYNTLALYPDYEAYPVDVIDELAMLEPKAMDGRCLKPKHCLDLMLHARKGPYQSTMDREDVKIKRVPTALAYALADKMNELVPLNPIYFARSKSGRQWHVLDIDLEDGEVDNNFKNVVLKFAPSSALKALVVDIGLVDKGAVTTFADVEVADYYRPVEYGYAPFALAGVYDDKHRLLKTSPGNWRGTWPEKIAHHIEHWGYNELARNYARNDVVYTRKLWEHFNRPEMDDDDSILACMVGSVRWKGFTLDIPGINLLKVEAQKEADKIPFIWAPEKVMYYIKQSMDEIEQAFITSTGKIVLEEIATWSKNDPSSFEPKSMPHPAAIKAREVLDARSADKEVELYNKLIHAGRFNPSFKVIGTLSTRMSGADGLNPQGINHDEHVRSKFPLSPGGNYQLDGGDFDGFEVCLADAEYNDPNLHKDLMSGKKIHALFGQYVFTDMTYEQILADKDVYTKCKQAVFALLYGGEAETLKTRLGVDLETANEAYRRFTSVYPQVGVARKKVFDLFCLTKDNWIMTDDGPKVLYELIGKPFMALVNGQPYKSSGFRNSGKKEVFEIETEHGYKLKASANQPLLVNYLADYGHMYDGINSWTKVSDLKIGDSLKLHNHKDVSWDTHGTYDDGYILGWLFGDGSIANSQYRNDVLYFYKDDQYLLPYMEKLLGRESVYVPQSNCYTLKSDKLTQLILDFDIANDKQVTRLMEGASSDFYYGFLSAFFDSDGTSYSKNKWISLSQSDLNRLEAVQRMLLRLGIQSSIKKANKPGFNVIEGRKVKVKQSWTLNIYAANCFVFQNRIGFKHPDKRAKLQIAIDKCDPKKMYKNYFVTKVKSIVSKGVFDVYDTTVETAQCFDAQGLFNHNCSMRQPGGLGSKVEWHEPADYIESLFGFRRYFTLENRIAKTLFTLAQDPPKDWTRLKLKVTRRDREQTVSGACMSALYGAAFSIQAAAMRAACNHRIQSSGAQVTKKLQRRIWDIQPSGVGDWLVEPLNIHDEVNSVDHQSVVGAVDGVVHETVESFRETVPLIKMIWKKGIKTWAEK
jgi:intein/homing endonuclease